MGNNLISLQICIQISNFSSILCCIHLQKSEQEGRESTAHSCTKVPVAQATGHYRELWGKESTILHKSQQITCTNQAKGPANKKVSFSHSYCSEQSHTWRKISSRHQGTLLRGYNSSLQPLKQKISLTSHSFSDILWLVRGSPKELHPNDLADASVGSRGCISDQLYNSHPKAAHNRSVSKSDWICINRCQQRACQFHAILLPKPLHQLAVYQTEKYVLTPWSLSIIIVNMQQSCAVFRTQQQAALMFLRVLSTTFKAVWKTRMEGFKSQTHLQCTWV